MIRVKPAAKATGDCWILTQKKYALPSPTRITVAASAS